MHEEDNFADPDVSSKEKKEKLPIGGGLSSTLFTLWPSEVPTARGKTECLMNRPSIRAFLRRYYPVAKHKQAFSSFDAGNADLIDCAGLSLQWGACARAKFDRVTGR